MTTYTIPLHGLSSTNMRIINLNGSLFCLTSHWVYTNKLGTNNLKNDILNYFTVTLVKNILKFIKDLDVMGQNIYVRHYTCPIASTIHTCVHLWLAIVINDLIG